MQYIDGTDLREVIRRDGALEPQRAVALLAQITSALDAAHEKGLVHRDVKPANVLISIEGGEEHAYLTDFGIAKRLDTRAAFTAAGAVLGTVDYMPPEMITGEGRRYTGAPTVVATGEASIRDLSRSAAETTEAPRPEPERAPEPEHAFETQATRAPDPTRGPDPTRAPELVSRRVDPGPDGIVTAAAAAASTSVLASTALAPVPTNRVHGNGNATVRLNGDVATVTVDTNGLLDGAPHALHIHAGGLGQYPPAAAARHHNGNLSISTTDGTKFYGRPQVALTTTGGHEPEEHHRLHPLLSVGNIRYTRTITLSPTVAGEIRDRNAAIVVHGIDYNGNGIYDNVMTASLYPCNPLTDISAGAALLCHLVFAAPPATGRPNPETGTRATAT
jgi:hypothetical protein